MHATLGGQRRIHGFGLTHRRWAAFVLSTVAACLLLACCALAPCQAEAAEPLDESGVGNSDLSVMELNREATLTSRSPLSPISALRNQGRIP